jgi:hypothetical protein
VLKKKRKNEEGLQIKAVRDGDRIEEGEGEGRGETSNRS